VTEMKTILVLAGNLEEFERYKTTRSVAERLCGKIVFVQSRRDFIGYRPGHVEFVYYGQWQTNIWAAAFTEEAEQHAAALRRD